MDINLLLYIFGSVILVSAISLIGIFTFALKTNKLEKILLYLVSFSVGALFGDAFIHLLPEAFESANNSWIVGLYVLFGILFSFIIEKVIHWRHCHVPTSKHHKHRFVYMNLVGDSVHNFIDGLIIAGSYFLSVPIGIATTVAVILHEIPQEIGDFGILVFGGFSKKRALFFNFLTALTAILGAIIGILMSSSEHLLLFLIPFAAGNFIYIAGSDLIPELHKEECAHNFHNYFFQLLMFILGILIMMSLLLLE